MLPLTEANAKKPMDNPATVKKGNNCNTMNVGCTELLVIQKLTTPNQVKKR